MGALANERIDPTPHRLRLEQRRFLDALARASSDLTSYRHGRLPDLAFRATPSRPLPRHVTSDLIALATAPAKTPGRKELIARARRLIARDGMDRVAMHFFEKWGLGKDQDKRWRSRRYDAKSHSWIKAVLEVFGGDRLALALAEGFEWWATQSETKRKRAALMMDVLVAIGTDTAMMILHDLTHVQDVTRVWERAGNLIGVEAKRRRLDSNRMADLAVPHAGVDTSGRRIFDVDERRLLLVLDMNLEPRCVDADTGERFVCLADVTEEPRAHEDWAHFVRTIERTVAIQNVRLEDAMVTGRRWTQAEWKEAVFEHPLMINYARRLVWGMFDADDDLVATFRATEDRELVDVDDETFVMPKGLRVGLAHPLHLGSGLRAAWSQSFGDYEIFAPIDQLGRATFSAPPKGKYEDVTFSGSALRAVMKRNMWRHAKGSHMKLELERGFGHGVRAKLRLERGFETWRKGVRDQKIAAITMSHDSKARTDIAWSETVRTLEETLGYA